MASGSHAKFDASLRESLLARGMKSRRWNELSQNNAKESMKFSKKEKSKKRRLLCCQMQRGKNVLVYVYQISCDFEFKSCVGR